MPIIKVNRNDLDKFRPVKNLGWKVVECINISDATPSKKGTSMNYWASLKILHPDDSDKGLEFDHCCNTSGTGYIAPFVAAMNNKTIDELFAGQVEIDMNLDSCVRRVCEANVGHRVDDNGKVNNDVQEWAPLGTHFPDFKTGGAAVDGDSAPF